MEVKPATPIQANWYYIHLLLCIRDELWILYDWEVLSCVEGSMLTAGINDDDKTNYTWKYIQRIYELWSSMETRGFVLRQNSRQFGTYAHEVVRIHKNAQQFTTIHRNLYEFTAIYLNSEQFTVLYEMLWNSYFFLLFPTCSIKLYFKMIFGKNMVFWPDCTRYLCSYCNVKRNSASQICIGVNIELIFLANTIESTELNIDNAYVCICVRLENSQQFAGIHNNSQQFVNYLY